MSTENVTAGQFGQWEQEQGAPALKLWFDEAWEERGNLIARLGTRPADPQVSLGRLVRDRDAANERLARMQKSAATLPVGYRGVLGQMVADADVEYTRAAARAAEETAAIMNGSHPQSVARAEWDAAAGPDAERIADLTRQCTEHVARMSVDDWSITPMPSAEKDQAAWLLLNSNFASAEARRERTGQSDLSYFSALVEHRETAPDLAYDVSRVGYADALQARGYGY